MQNYGNFPFGVLVLLCLTEAFIFPLLLARNGSQLCVFTFPLVTFFIRCVICSR